MEKTVQRKKGIIITLFPKGPTPPAHRNSTRLEYRDEPTKPPPVIMMAA